MDTQNRTARKKHHIIYKTTCLKTGRYYIGMHSTNNLDDGYMGSGKRLWQSIKKHGLDQHRCEVIEHLPDRASLRAREAELVDQILLEDTQCMNIALGGHGSWDHVNLVLTKEQRIKAGKLGGYANRHLWTPLAREKHLASIIENGKKNWPTFFKEYSHKFEEWRAKGQKLGQTAALSIESKEKRKATMLANMHSQGIKNSQYGKCWVYNDECSKSIKKEDLELYLEKGYKKGRKMTCARGGIGRRASLRD